MGMRTTLGAIGMVTCAFVALGAREAKACGGCFHQQAGTQSFSDITDERMLLSVSPQETTLYDQIRYAGTPQDFAWVLPIKGTVVVGLSSDVMFDSIDALTATQITGPSLDCPSCGGGGGCGAIAGGSSSDNATGGSYQPPVTVTKQEIVGPYETVQLHSNDGSGDALSKWLTDAGYAIPDDVKPTIAAYVGEGFDFLAMKLLPGAGVQAMRPVRVTTPGGGVTLPLRMAAVGTGATVGITLWVVASGRYEPQNFHFFHIEDSDLVWDWKTSSSNYTTLRAQNETALASSGWEIESSIDVATATIRNAILSSGASVASGSAAQVPADDDYSAMTGSDPVSDPDAGIVIDAGTLDESADEVRADDIGRLLAPSTGNVVRVTRMRTDIAHAAMNVDLLLRASSDQSELSNQRLVTNAVNAPACPTCDDGGCDTPAVHGEGAAGFGVTIFALVGLVFTRVVRVRRKK